MTALAGLHRITRKQPDIATADEAEVEERATVHTFLADAHFLADADAVMTAPNADDELVTRTVRSESGLLVGVDLVFEVNGHEVVAVRAASKAVVFAEKGFADPVEAWDELGEALATVPGLRLPEDWGNWPDEADCQITIAGQGQVVDVHWSAKGWGSMTLCVGDEEVSVSCEYDDTPWPGRPDDYNGMRRYYLLTDGPRQFAVNAAWELPAWVIEQVTGVQRS